MEGKRVTFTGDTKNDSPETGAKIAIISQCYRKIYPDMPLGCLEEQPRLDEDDFLSEKWKVSQRKNKAKDQNKNTLDIVIPQLIQNIAQTARDLSDNYPAQLMCYEFLHWCKSILEQHSNEQETLAKIKLRVNYIVALLRSNLLSQDKDDEKIRQLLNILKTSLRKQIPDSSITQLNIQLANILKNGKAFIETGLQFLHILLSNTDPTPIPDISKLDPKDECLTLLSNTKRGRLLSILLTESPLKEIYKEKEQPQQSLSPRVLLSPGVHRKSSAKQLRITNPFIAYNNEYSIRIPITVLTHYQYNLSTLPIQYFNCQNGMTPTELGIHSPFLNEHTINAFINIHALLYELSRVLLSCKEALDLVEEDYDLLEFQQINSSIVDMMKLYSDLLSELQSNVNYLASSADNIFKACATNKSMIDPCHTTWMRNYGTISTRKEEFDATLTAICRATHSISEIARKIPVETRQNIVIQKLMQFEQAVSLQNKEINAILTNVKKPAAQSQKLSPRGSASVSPPHSQPPSPTVSRNPAPPEPPKKLGRGAARRQAIQDSLSRRRRPANPAIVIPFVIPEPEDGANLSTTPSEASRPPPPAQSPPPPRKSESPEHPLGQALGLPVMPRSGVGSHQAAEDHSLFLSSHSPRPVHDANAPELPAAIPVDATPALDAPSPQKEEPKDANTPELPAAISVDATPALDAPSPQKEEPKIAHCLTLFGIKKPKKNQPARCYYDKDIPEILSLIRPDTVSVELQKNEITGIGAVQLCQVLATHTSIRQLNLSSNPALFAEIDSARSPNYCPYPAAKALEEFLETNTSLKEFWLSQCCFTLQTCISFFANGLRNNESLEFFDIGENNITDDSAIILFDAILQHPTLFSLAIDGNQLTDEAAKVLLELVKNNTKITFVKFDRNNISDELTRAIQAQVLANWQAHESSSNVELKK